MLILVLNAGSSSLKYKLLDMPGEEVLAAGLVERVGEEGREALARHAWQGVEDPPRRVPCADHAQALELVLAALTGPGRLAGLGEIDALGHRVVHGGEVFTAPTRLDAAVVERLEELVELAPLHLPPAISCIKACLARLPAAPQVAHFDTMWHQGMPPEAYLYPVPLEWYERFGVRRYGFHGSSHQYVTLAAARMLGRPAEELRLITAHLGNGASLAAWDRGRVRDTSMGLTPLEGVMMGTRGGDLDPALVTYVAERAGLEPREVVRRLNHDSGLKAIGGQGRDLRKVLAAREAGHERAALAFAMYVHRLRKYLGAYWFHLGGADGVVFTGGIGENAWQVREALFEGLEGVGLHLDPGVNRAMVGGRAGIISRPESRAALLVIPTDEELMIAREVVRLLAGPGGGRSFPG